MSIFRQNKTEQEPEIRRANGMLSKRRWRNEKELVASFFPGFRPFQNPPRFGFQGHFRGRKTGRLFEVVLESDEVRYPHFPPAIYLNPRVGPDGYWMPDGQLSVTMEWRPSQSTFALVLITVIRYLDETDAQPDSSQTTSSTRSRADFR